MTMNIFVMAMTLTRMTIALIKMMNKNGEDDNEYRLIVDLLLMWITSNEEYEYEYR